MSNSPVDAPRDYASGSLGSTPQLAALVSSLGHAFRTPISQVLGYGRIVEEGVGGDLTEEQARYVRRMTDAVAEVHALVDELIALGDLRSGVEEVTLEACDVDQLLLNACPDPIRPGCSAR